MLCDTPVHYEREAAKSISASTVLPYNYKDENKIKEVISFFMARVLTLIVDVLIMLIFVNVLGFNDKIMKIISQVIVIVSNYILSKVFVFKEER